ncbi:class I SAM-dependent methyltransferase [Pseudonocardia sp. GCM10023141]|uniref:class I SAM-dependent methyltransferase n=1 Tax=Pseudonocardia sp. GCM10023141 TaxID=3252653 RepID=UPI003608E094
MRLRRLLLVPQIVRLAAQAPRDGSTRWDGYWASVTSTGDGGDVLWDSSTSNEAEHYLDLLSTHADADLPIVDVGCGNGRFTRALATRFPGAIGLDLSRHAITRARHESASVPDLQFRTLDMTADRSGRALAAEFGPCNVFIRGVLHVLTPPARRRMAANLAELLGTVRATALVAETNYPGSLLGYLENLGARPTTFPTALGRAISAGIPRPAPFGDTELDDTFPTDRWNHLHTDNGVRISTVPSHRSETIGSIPGLVALLRPWRGPSSPH